MRSGDFQKKNMFRRRKNLILLWRCGSSKASTEVVYRPRSQSPLHFDMSNAVVPPPGDAEKGGIENLQ